MGFCFSFGFSSVRQAHMAIKAELLIIQPYFNALPEWIGNDTSKLVLCQSDQVGLPKTFKVQELRE